MSSGFTVGDNHFTPFDLFLDLADRDLPTLSLAFCKQIWLFTPTHLAALSSLEGFQERRGCLQPNLEGAVTMKGQGCFGLLRAEALLSLKHFLEDLQLFIFTAPKHESFNAPRLVLVLL